MSKERRRNPRRRSIPIHFEPVMVASAFEESRSESPSSQAKETDETSNPFVIYICQRDAGAPV